MEGGRSAAGLRTPDGPRGLAQVGRGQATRPFAKTPGAAEPPSRDAPEVDTERWPEAWRESIAVRSMPWREQGGDFDRFLGAAIRERAGGRQRVRRALPDPHTGMRRWHNYSAPELPVAADSWIVVELAEPDQVHIYVAGTSEPNPAGLAFWKTVVHAALSRLSSAERDYRWEAVLGVDTTLWRFTEEAQIGPVSLVPGPAPARTDVSFPFVPIYARGIARGISWMDSKSEARRIARLAAAALSVAWEQLVKVHWEALCYSEGEGAGVLHQVDPNSIHVISTTGGPPHVVELRVPEWLNQAWPTLISDIDLRNAVLVYHEALRLEYENHFSFAAAALVAALESVGARDVPLGEKCATCGAETGAGRRYRHAVRLVPTDRATRRLLDDMYGAYRSQTVHVGVLHGAEAGGQGWTQRGNPFVHTGTEDFDERDFPALKRHCVAVLTTCLRAAGSGGDAPS